MRVAGGSGPKEARGGAVWTRRPIRRRCSPGTTATAAICRGAPRRASGPIPYHVWLSEIMLQQTTVKAVGPYYMKFLARWPDVQALAAAPLDDVLKAWAGLGYYARARNLHACAKAVAGQHGGHFPDTEDGLRALPGIGGYTAAAIAAIAFDRRAVAIDGNIERVIARLFAIETELPAAKTEIRARAETLVPQRRAGDFTQAMMDLGATICTPKKPACGICPVDRRFARRARAATPRRFRARRRRSRAGCATARRSLSLAPMAMCWSARGRARGCSAA